MESFTPTSVLTAHARAWKSLLTLLLLWLIGAGGAHAQSAPKRAYYSTGSNVAVVKQPSPQVAGSGNVTAGINAADGDVNTFAILKTDANVSVGNPVALRLGLTQAAPAGYRAGVVLANAATLLSLNALGTVTLRTYLTGASPELREEKVVRLDIVRAALGAGSLPTQLEFVSSKSFDAVEIEIGGALGINYITNIYYAYGVRPGLQTRATGYLSRFTVPTSAEYSTASSTGGVCVNTDVDDAANVADISLTNFATMRSTLTVACNPSLRTKLAGVPTGGVPAGYYAGFVIGQNSLLDVSVLSGLRLTTYKAGVKAEASIGANLLQLTLLPDNKAQVSFVATKVFDEVQIERIGVLTALDDLQVFYGFGLAPSAFQGINPVLSNFADPANNVDYFASAAQVIQVFGLGLVTLSSVSNPSFAADVDNTNFAQLNTTGLGVLLNTATASLKLKLNGSGRAGNRVGMVISSGAGLLDLNLLPNLTLSTYDSTNTLIEAKTGAALLSTTLLGSTSQSRISFQASRDFQFVKLEVNAVASLFTNTRIYYAFAEDIPLLSLAAPLPVELTAFTGRWNNGAADLAWSTALEKNSSHFLVERSIGGDVAFQAIGKVLGAGSSNTPKDYKLRDAEAGNLGVTTLYYRLRQVDNDGTETFSPVVVVAVAKAVAVPQLETYPNPAPDAQAVKVRFVNMPAGGGLVQTYSEMGQLVSQQPVGPATTGLVLPRLAPGLYHVVLRDAAGQRLATQRLIISGQ
ncbi:T9SS type A sorting domain-containing protein [Hymenobacter artigasi]|uniref:T9SS type A sorting domain-containing protein n=1 Tax=Hymenobacter artigasi TaxID=2719616 RepID=A0ABX1HDY5_9BACT|nr:T9SS type A sorting domain-containing protein [Hymenobacter artigasi]NKI88392.1 hypothetical protein [Hymenobacter artigasi]